jgi:predicted PurR-regulated permease PerM
VENKRPLLVLIYLAITVAAVWLIQFLWELLSQAGVFVVMLLVAWILAVGTLGPVRLLRRLNIPRLVAAVTVFLGLLGLVGITLFFVLPPLFEQIGHAAETLTLHARNVPDGLLDLESRLIKLGVPGELVSSAIADASNQLAVIIQEIAAGILTTTGTIASGVAAALVTLIISFYLLLGWDRGVRSLEDSLPPEWSARFRRGIRASEHTFGAWLSGQFIASVIWGVALAIIYALAGLEFGLLIAVTTGILLFIPFFGMTIGILIPIAMAISVRIDLSIWVGISVTTVSFVLENVLKPRIMGTAIGVNPIVILSSVILGGIAAGFWGVLFGIPIGALLWTFARWGTTEFLHSHHPGGHPAPSIDDLSDGVKPTSVLDGDNGGAASSVDGPLTEMRP